MVRYDHTTQLAATNQGDQHMHFFDIIDGETGEIYAEMEKGDTAADWLRANLGKFTLDLRAAVQEDHITLLTTLMHAPAGADGYDAVNIYVKQR